jgi:hypothetical protein
MNTQITKGELVKNSTQLNREEIIKMIDETKETIKWLSESSTIPQYYKGVLEGMELIKQKLKK